MAEAALETPSAEGHTRESNGSDIILAISAAFLVGLLIRTISGLLPARWKAVKLPYTALMLLLGGSIAAITIAGGTAAYMTDGLIQLESISPSVLFAVFIPALIVPSGLGLQWWITKHVLDKALLLAVPGTALSAALIALVARYIFPYGWTWAGSWLFGSILAATDPIAVIAIMHSCGASVKLATVIEGESLLNDGVAYVLFEIFLGWASGEPVTAGGVAAFVCKASLGSPSLGLVWAGALILWLRILFNDAIAEVTASLVAAYTLWIVSDEMLGLSGMLALVFFGAAMGAYGKYAVSRRAARGFTYFWEWIDWAANTLVFFLSGLLIATEISRSSDTISSQDWAYACALWALLLVIRVVMVIIFFPLLQRGSYGLIWRDCVVLSWAGLRGAVGLTLALTVYQSPDVQTHEYRNLVFFHVACMAVATLIIQGSTTTILLKWLGYMHLPAAKQNAMLYSAEAVERLGRRLIKEAMHEKHNLLGEADWAKVTALTALEVVDKVRGRPSKEIERALKNSASMHNAIISQRLVTEDGEMNGRQLQVQVDDARVAGAGAAEVEVRESKQEALEDLRARLLQAVQAQYAEAFDQEFLSPTQAYTLRESVNYGLDVVGIGLADWQALRQSLPSAHALDSNPRNTYWRQVLARVWRRQRHAVRRAATLTATFAYAHAEARKELCAFVDLELIGIEDVDVGVEADPEIGQPIATRKGGRAGAHDGDGASQCRDTGECSSPPPGEVPQAPLRPSLCSAESSLDSLFPVWKASNDGLDAAQWTGSLSPRPSLIPRLATRRRAMVADLHGCLENVLEESRQQQRGAEEYLAGLKKVDSRAVQDARTEMVAVAVLKSEEAMLQRLVRGGLLEEKEVDEEFDKVERRMKNMHEMYSLD